MRRLPALLLLAALALPAAAQSAFEQIDPDDPSPFSDAVLVTEAASIAPGDSFEVALVLTQDPTWHSYWLNGGDAGQPTSLDWRLPDGVTASDLRFPVPEAIALSGLVSYGYEDEVALLATVTVPADYAGEEVVLEGTADWLICADICLPATAEVQAVVPVGETSRPARAAAFDEWRAMLPASVRGWTTEAIPTEGGFDLRVIPAPDWEGETESAYFFPLTTGVIDYAAPQPLSRDGEAWVLALDGSGIADTPDRLEGILAFAEAGALDGTHRGLWVRAPVPLLAAGAGGGSTEAGGVASLWVALLLAFGGGLLLNLMPCVFPILSIKILGFAQGRDARPGVMRRHGLLFGAGVLVSFLALAGALLALRGAGEAVGWGFQLQSPAVIAALAVLMVVLALWMLGAVEFGGRLMGTAARADRGEGASGAFLSGVLATVVATPCTAPFMGAALGWALVQPALAALAVFAMLGVGMALPYVLLSFMPAWLQRLPKPGPWMETLKQALAFPLFLTAVWLVWTFGAQTGINGAAALLAALVLVGLAAWVVGRWPGARVTGAMRFATRGLAIVALGGALALTVFGARQTASAASSDGTWAAWDRTEVDTLVVAGEPVFIDFTATWCLTCQANKGSTLRTEAVEQAFADRGVHLFVADWTRRDDDITAALDALGRSGVPVYALYPGNSADPILLPEILTPGVVLDALERVSGPVASR
ncbi:MAG: protein-disulfide reductase DsbD domain-containing protein [Bacteroidota bacterium]